MFVSKGGFKGTQGKARDKHGKRGGKTSQVMLLTEGAKEKEVMKTIGDTISWTVA